MQLQSEKLTGVLFEEEQAPPTSLVNMAPSDVSTLNMLKYGMLALQLLPENSSAGASRASLRWLSFRSLFSNRVQLGAQQVAMPAHSEAVMPAWRPF